MPNFSISGVLDRAREINGLKSDYALCKAFDLAPNSVSHWRHGRALPDEKSCQILALAADLDPLVLAAQVQAQRSKTTEARSMWEAIAERLQVAAHGLAAAVFAVAIATFLLAEDADAAGRAAGVDYVSEGVNSLYIVSSCARCSLFGSSDRPRIVCDRCSQLSQHKRTIQALNQTLQCQ